jgi:hypothetical protein
MALQSDNFEILRDCRALFLKHLRALLQDSGLISGNAIAAIQDGAGSYFDEVIASNRRGSFAEEVDGLTSSRITLLAEDDLELGIRLDNLTARLFETTGGSLWKLHLRFVTLLRRPELPKSENPVGPKSICRGLDAMFAAAGVSSLEQKLTLLDRIEAWLNQNLPALYAELNDFLERNGIDAAQPAIITAPDSPTAAREVPAAALSGNALQALQQALAGRLPAVPEGATPAAGGAAASLLSQTALEQLMFRLEALERMGRFGPPVLPGGSPAGEPMMPALFSESDAPSAPKIIRSAELGLPKTSSESLAIDTLAMIFEAIFADPELPDILKAAVSSLQIRLLKVAMKDASLFTDAEHPARLVLDRMAQAALGLPLDVSARHPVCVRLFELASRLRTEQGADRAGFETALADLDSLIADRNQEIASAAAPYLPLLEQAERGDLLTARVTQTIAAALEQQPPAAVHDFLDRTWRQVLLQVGREHAPDSPQWQEYSAAIDGLLWSFQPKTAAEDRKQLAQRVPQMLKVLKQGMEHVGLSATEQESFLDECFRLQTQALRASASPSPEQTAAIGAAALRLPTGEPVGGEIRGGDLVLPTFDYPDLRSPPTRAPAYAVGDWLAFRGADDAVHVGQVCHISESNRRALLLNPNCHLAIAIHAAILDRQLREGEAAIRSGASLFDRAASRALGQTART